MKILHGGQLYLLSLPGDLRDSQFKIASLLPCGTLERKPLCPCQVIQDCHSGDNHKSWDADVCISSFQEDTDDGVG